MNRLQETVISSLMASLICVATMVISIPIAGSGYINLGDCLVLLSAFMLRPLFAGLAAGIGSALADIFLGFAAFAPATFIIKFLMGLAAALIFKRMKGSVAARIIASVGAEAIMTAGYFAFEAMIMQQGTAAAYAIPMNLIQGAAGIMGAMLVYPIVKRIFADIRLPGR